MSYRSDLDALEARHTALEADVATRSRELDETRRLLDDARARVRLPVLDNIRVAAPCAADWSGMVGDDRVRHCGDCRKNVYNLSEMTREEAQTLLVAHEGRLCVRYYKRHDGTILTADCPTGVKRRRRRRWFAAGVVTALAGSIFGWTWKRAGAGSGSEVMMGDVSPVKVVMGKVAAPTPHPEPEAVMGQMIAPATAPK